MTMKTKDLGYDKGARTYVKAHQVPGGILYVTTAVGHAAESIAVHTTFVSRMEAAQQEYADFWEGVEG